MQESIIYFWVAFGAFLVFAELILPGLVSVFVGLGALTVAALVYLNQIDSVSSQLTTWFISSTVYIFSLRLLVMKYYPSDTEFQDIDEDQAMIGKFAQVVEEISKEKSGRIEYGETTWVAIALGEEVIPVGESVEIVGRQNITWLVKRKS